MRQYTENFAQATAPIKLKKPKPIQKQEPQAQPIPKPIAKPMEKKSPVQPKENMMDGWKNSLKSISDDFATLMRGRKG